MNSSPHSPQISSSNQNSAPSLTYSTWRETFVQPMLIGALVFGLLALVPALMTNQGIIQNSVFILSYLLLFVVTFVRFPYWVRMGVFLFVIYGLGLNELVSTGILGDSIFFFLGLVMFATLMFSPRIGVVAAIITLITFAIMGWLVQTGQIHLLNAGSMVAKTSDWLSTSATTMLFCATFILGLRQLQIGFVEAQTRASNTLRALEAERSSLESRVAARTLQLTTMNEVGRAASAILNPDQLIERVVSLITDRFGYYYAALFLVNEAGDEAVLHGATGEAGRLLKENKHHLRVGGNSMVGMAISTRQARIALEAGAEPMRFENPLLPYTRSEIALPLVVGDRVLGALDVQSTKAGAFGQQDIETFQSMASQVAIAFENARLFQNSQHNLKEMHSIQRQYVLETWKPLSTDAPLQYSVGEEDQPASNSQLEIPISLHDETIGQINLSAEADWTPEQRNLIETVVAQAALALENARLVEQSQASASYEHQLVEITGKIWAAASIDDILQSTVRELGRALDVNQGTIELKMDSHGE